MVGRPMMNCLVYTLNEMDIAVRDTLDSLTVTAFGTDSILVNAQQDVRDVSLPLRYTADSTILFDGLWLSGDAEFDFCGLYTPSPRLHSYI